MIELQVKDEGDNCWEYFFYDKGCANGQAVGRSGGQSSSKSLRHRKICVLNV
jgi:hypothetical protein